MPVRGPGGSSSVKLATRDSVAIEVACAPVTFIVSFNEDDDNDNRRRDYQERISPTEENNLREFIFNLIGRDEVFIAEPTIIATGLSAISEDKRLRAYNTDKQTSFDFTRNHHVPVTMYLEGIKTSGARNDIFLEYQYFRGGTPDCGPGAQGTVVDVDANFAAPADGGSSFKKANKMLITGTGQANATLAPAGIGTTEWTYDGQARLPTPDQLSTAFNADTIYTPVNRMDRDLLRFRLTDNGQIIEAHHPVNLTAPIHLDADKSDFTYTSGWLDANVGTFDAVGLVRIKYQIQDQQRERIKESAYAGRVPQVKENIRNVLTSSIDSVAKWIRQELDWTPAWTDKPSGIFRDRIEARDINKDIIVETTPTGRRMFYPILQAVGGVMMHVSPPHHHIWELSVSGRNATAGTQNTFSTVTDTTRLRGGGIQIKIRSRYVVVTP